MTKPDWIDAKGIRTCETCGQPVGNVVQMREALIDPNQVECVQLVDGTIIPISEHALAIVSRRANLEAEAREAAEDGDVDDD